jgi:hypothetical protein
VQLITPPEYSVLSPFIAIDKINQIAVSSNVQVTARSCAPFARAPDKGSLHAAMKAFAISITSEMHDLLLDIAPHKTCMLVKHSKHQALLGDSLEKALSTLVNGDYL